MKLTPLQEVILSTLISIEAEGTWVQSVDVETAMKKNPKAVRLGERTRGGTHKAIHRLQVQLEAMEHKWELLSSRGRGYKLWRRQR